MKCGFQRGMKLASGLSVHRQEKLEFTAHRPSSPQAMSWMLIIPVKCALRLMKQASTRPSTGAICARS